MEYTALATQHKMLSEQIKPDAADTEPLEFFVVPVTVRGFLWLAKNKLLGKKLCDPLYNKATGYITGKIL